MHIPRKVTQPARVKPRVDLPPGVMKISLLHEYLFLNNFPSSSLAALVLPHPVTKNLLMIFLLICFFLVNIFFPPTSQTLLTNCSDLFTTFPLLFCFKYSPSCLNPHCPIQVWGRGEGEQCIVEVCVETYSQI